MRRSPAPVHPAPVHPQVQLAHQALGWLVAGNLLGLLLAGLLLVPALGSLLGPFTYGRLAPLHLDLQLYGWCALPLVGLLLHLYLPHSKRSPAADRAARFALHLWSATLAFGAVSWLAGDTSGKLFLDWSGPARGLLVVMLVVLDLALAFALWRRVRAGGESRWSVIARAAVLVALLAVPVGLYTASGPAGAHPPINPETGGTTGTSVFGATLGTAGLFAVLPFLLGLRPEDGGRRTRWTVVALAVGAVAFALLDHGDVSRGDPWQVVAVASLVAWPPILALHLRRFPWSPACRRWLAAAGAWGVLLVTTGLLTYAPGILQGWKFTNALVGHAHLAMAGLISSLGVLILRSLLASTGSAALFSDVRSFALWQGGSLVMVVSLLALGTAEAMEPGLVFRAHPLVESLYGLRWLAGLAMTAASIRWLVRARRLAAWSVFEEPIAEEPDAEEPTAMIPVSRDLSRPDQVAA